MGELDSAKSRRRDKPALFATLDMAIAQAGVVGITADDVYPRITWAVDQGRRFPWYYKNEKAIVADWGGYDTVYITVAGAALGLLASGDQPDIVEAAWHAAADWRNDLRIQWGDRDRADWQVPATFTDIGSTLEPSHRYSVEDWLTEHSLELVQPSGESFDPENIENPKLAALWLKLSPTEREVMHGIADGIAPVHISPSARTHKRNVKRKAMAMGPAA